MNLSGLRPAATPQKTITIKLFFLTPFMKLSSKTVLLSLVGVIFASTLVEAQQSPAQKSAAEDLLSLMNSREVMLSAFSSVMGPMLAKVPEAKAPAVKAAFMRFAESVADAPELNEKIIGLYSEAFTEAELREIIAFYSTPTGKKALAKLPELMQKGAIIGQKIAEEKQGKFQEEIKAIMEEK
ncbi:MAG: hypothetical protein JWL81_1029 [Verrucomicrobiales bacterium]|nr:hypothetical protein [Verrucomicrobiales bacterium]